MNRALSLIGFLVGVVSSVTASAQGYTVMGGSPGGAAPAPQTTLVVPPAPTGAAPVGAIEQVTPSRERAPRGLSSPVAPRRPEEYGGITPGMPALPPGLRRARRPGGAPYVAWPGFQMIPGGSRAFVVLTTPQPVTELPRNGRVRTYHIANARILLSNNRRPLITEAFETPLARVSLRPSRGGADLVLELRADVEPTMMQETSAQGFHYVYFHLPAFAMPESARIRLPGGTEVPIITQPGAGAPQIVVGQPRPGTDTERPPGMR